MKLWSDQSEQTSGLHMWNNSDISCRNTENILTMNAARRGYSLHAFLTRLILYFLFLWKCQGLAGNTNANFSLHTHLSVCSVAPSLSLFITRNICFLQLVLRLICLHPCKRADGLNVFQVYDISSSFNLKSLYLSFIQHSIQGVMLQSDVTRLTGVLPLHIRVKLRNTLQLR